MAPNRAKDTDLTGTLNVAGAINLNGVAIGEGDAVAGLNSMAILAIVGIDATASGIIGGDAWLSVEAQASPNLTVQVKKGTCLISGTLTGITSDLASLSGFAAPSANPRRDIVQISTAGAITRKAGTENASPSKPSPDANNLELAEVYNRVGQTSVKNTDDSSNGYIVKTTAHL